MKKKRVTYGVSGMMEYQAIIKVGRASIKVLFSDGSMNAMGTNPATYSTSNLMIQHAIENSDQYKRGRIHTVKTILLDEDVHIDRNTKVEEVIDTETEPISKSFEDTECDLEIGEARQDDQKESQVVKVSGAESIRNEITEMEFDNNDDAKDFLESNFGFIRSKLRNRADIIAAGKMHGISISFT